MQRAKWIGLFLIGVSVLALLHIVAFQTRFDKSVVNGVTAILLISAFVLSLASITFFLFSFFAPGKILNTGLLFASLFIALIISELFIRYKGSQTTYLEQRDRIYRSYYDITPRGWYLTWGEADSHFIATPEFKYWRPTNEYGLGDYSFDSLSKLPGIKIMGLGDSFTEGDGTPYDSTWLKLLARMLEKKMDTPIVTMNAGICGNDPVYSVFQFKNEFIQYRPDIAILCMNHTDIHDIKARGGCERFRADTTVVYSRRPWWESYYAISHIFRLFIHNGLHRDYNFISRSEFEANIPLYTDTLQKAASVFIETCQKNNIYPIIVLHPLKGEMTDERYSKEMQMLDDKIRLLHGFTYVDVLEYYLTKEKSALSPSQLYWEQDNHFNSKGYEIVAQALDAKLDSLWFMKLPVVDSGR